MSDQRFNTGNPIGSDSPQDRSDNTRNLDVAVNAEQDTFQDRLGKSRLTWAGIVKAGTGDAAIAVDAADRAVDAADRAESAESSVEQIAQQAASAVIAGVDGQVAVAQSAAVRAEAARDETILNALIAADVADGLSKTSATDPVEPTDPPRYFRIFSPDDDESFIYYRHDTGGVATELKRLSSDQAVKVPAGKINALYAETINLYSELFVDTRVEIVADLNGSLRVVTKVDAQTGATNYIAATSIRSELDIQTITDLPIPGYPDYMRTVADSEGVARIIELRGSNYSGPTVFGAYVAPAPEPEPTPADVEIFTLKPLATALLPPAPDSDVIYGYLSYGQSLSVGSQGSGTGPGTFISDVQLFNNLTFIGGTKTGLTDNTHGANPTTDMDLAIPLVEDGISATGAVRGETVCSGAANGAVELALRQNGIDPANMVFFASAPGKGGATVAELRLSAEWGQNFKDHVDQMQAVAAGLGKTLHIAFISYMQGEADQGQSLAYYKPQLEALIDECQVYCQTVTGQETPPHFIFYQQGSGGRRGVNSQTGAPPLAQYQLSVERPDCWFGGPIYPLPGIGDRSHGTPVTYIRAGRAFSRVMKSIVADRSEPLQFRPLSAYVLGSTVTINMTMRGELSGIPYGFATNSGFALFDEGGEQIDVESVVVEGTKVIIELAEESEQPVRAAYALDHALPGSPFGDSAGGNLRSERSDVFYYDNYVTDEPFWCPAFEINVYKLG